MGACGVLLMNSDAIGDWVDEVRKNSNGAFQLNNWIPDPAPDRDPAHENRVRAFLGNWGPAVPPEDADARLPDFDAQCAAMLEAGPAVISSIMGLFSSHYVARMKARNIKWFATVTTVGEALAAEAAGADVIMAQGMEAGGHRGAFNAADAESTMVGLFSLLPAIVDAVQVPVVATGGIADARTAAAALTLGASAVQIGTGLLRTPEAAISKPWADALGQTNPEDTIGTRSFSGRLGRSIRTRYAEAWLEPDAPAPAPYPTQRNLTQAMRKQAAERGDLERMQAWAGQSAKLAQAKAAETLVTELWSGTLQLIEGERSA